MEKAARESHGCVSMHGTAFEALLQVLEKPTVVSLMVFNAGMTYFRKLLCPYICC